MSLKNKTVFFSVTIICIAMAISSCRKNNPIPEPVLETGTVTDIEGNIYKTVKIGSQWWMSENLQVKKFRNGNPIPEVIADTAWQNNCPAFCLFQNNTASPGLLYNWYAITDTGNIAPAGWHIPTDDEWKELERTLGMSDGADKSGWRGTDEGDKLKIEAPDGWSHYANVWGTNTSGFSALAGGCRLNDGRWAEPGLFATGFWWTASAYSTDEAWHRYLDYKNSNVFRSVCSKNYGFSVRCVKD